jgi:predicted transcriptional regulator
MSARRRFTFALSSDLAARLEATVPSRQRNAFVEKAVRAQLRLLEREELRAEMEECARAMYDEIPRIEADFHPLEEELHRQL